MKTEVLYSDTRVYTRHTLNRCEPLYQPYNHSLTYTHTNTTYLGGFFFSF